MAKERDYIVYTGSDPDAGFLIDYLEEKGFIVPSMDSGDCAMLIVMSPSRGKLVKALKETGKESSKYWSVSEVPKPTSL